MKKYSLSAFVAAGLLAGGLSVTSANAADLGGNCCADLEERIAELEATTARKGNRKVSLTVSGWVAQQVMYWDDGTESNTYVGDIGSTLASHVKFTGQATISPGWSAGYVLHIEAPSADSLAINEDSDDGNFSPIGVAGSGVNVLQSYWFLKSDSLGKVSVGLQSQASDNTAILVDGSGSLVPANWVWFDVASFGQGSSAPNAIPFGAMQICREGGVAGDCFGATKNVVRYDSPTFAGFSFSASWGEDDLWDVAARYAGEFGGVKLAVAGAYSESSDANNISGLGGSTDHTSYFQVGAYMQHVPTGLFVYGAYGDYAIEDDGLVEDVEQDTYYLKAGLRKRLNPLGHTVFYGEYGNNEVDYGDNLAGLETEVDWWGLGLVQEVDAAAMSMWLSYKHFEGDVNDGTEFDDFDMVKFGALINF